jgi:PAS domain S-box-containing protein
MIVSFYPHKNNNIRLNDGTKEDYLSTPLDIVASTVHSTMIQQHPTGNTDDFYQQVFYTCGVGMAICKMGGSFVDGNETFLQWCGYNQETIISKTIFDVIDRSDLPRAFHDLSQFIESVSTSTSTSTKMEDTRLVVVMGCKKQGQEQEWNIRVTVATLWTTKRFNNKKLNDDVPIPKHLILCLVMDHVK